MNIRLRKDGRYEAIIIKDGKRKSIYGKTKKEVVNKIADKLLDSRDVENLFSEYVKTWLYTYKYGLIKESSFNRLLNLYEVHIKNEKSFKINIAKLSDIDIQTYINKKSRNMSMSSLKKIYQMLIAVLKYAYAKNDIGYDIAGIIKIPRKAGHCTKIVENYSLQEVERIVKYVYSEECINDFNKRYYASYILIANTGLRLGEVMALRWNDVDLINNKLYVNKSVANLKDCETGKRRNVIDKPKTKKSVRIIPLNESAIKSLNVLRDIQIKNNIYNGCVVVNKAGDMLSIRRYQEAFKRMCDDIGVEYKGIHALRHTFVYMLMKSGNDLKTIADLCGHSGTMVTFKRYGHVDNEMHVNAINSINNYTEYVNN